MNLYDKDYRYLNNEELEALERHDSIRRGKIIISAEEAFAQVQITNECRAILFYRTLFPNNHLSNSDLGLNSESYNSLLSKFINLVNDKTTSERAILNFIKVNKAYFIIASIIKSHVVWGHHDRYIFPEFPLYPNYQVDYLICGKNSDGFHLLFVELENPYEHVTTKDGSFGSTLRKGIKQIQDWDEWIDKNFVNIRLVLEKQLSFRKQLPKELYELDKTRISYAVIGGRRSDFSEKTYRIRRKHLQESNIHILHYDNVIDSSRELLLSSTY